MNSSFGLVHGTNNVIGCDEPTLDAVKHTTGGPNMKLFNIDTAIALRMVRSMEAIAPLQSFKS